MRKVKYRLVPFKEDSETMNSLKKSTLSILLIPILIVALIAIWWVLESQPLRVGQVMRLLEHSVSEQQFTHIATERERCPNNRKIYTYHFEDNDGVAFTVVSRIVNGHYFEPRRLPASSDYLLSLARANQEYIIDLLGETGLTVELIDDDGTGIGSVRFVILVHNYDDLEPAAEAIKNAANSLGYIVSPHYNISFVHPRISVQHVNGTSVTTVSLWRVAAMHRYGNFNRLHTDYLDRIRWGLIDEELPCGAQGGYPRYLFNIYFDGKQVHATQNEASDSANIFVWNADLEEYTIWLFGDHNILTLYVDHMGGSYDFDLKEREFTWTIGEEIWVATLNSSPAGFIFEQVKRNGESLDIYGVQMMTLPVFARMLNLTFEIDQMAAAVYFWSFDDKY